MENLRARTYQPRDLETFVELFEANASGFRLPQEKKDLVRFLTQLPHSGLAILLETPQGQGAACGALAFKSGEEAALCWGMVAPSWQGKGLGEALRVLRTSLVCDMPGIKKLSVTVSQHDAPFFQSLGYRQESVTDGGYAPGLDKHYLVKDINDAVSKSTEKAVSELGLSVAKA